MRRWVPGLIALLGSCAQVLNLDEIAPLPARPCIADSFDAPTIDPRQWTVYHPAFVAPAPTIATEGGALTIDLAAGSGSDVLGYNGVYAPPLQLSGFALEVQLLAVTDEVNAETAVELRTSGSDEYYFAVKAGKMHLSNRTDRIDINYLADRDVWIRLYHDTAMNEVVLQTAPGPGGWQERARVPAIVPLDALVLHLDTGDYAPGITTAQRGSYDNLRLDAPGCLQ